MCLRDRALAKAKGEAMADGLSGTRMIAFELLARAFFWFVTAGLACVTDSTVSIP